jgi:DnaJ-class molecular chaperone
MPPNDGKRGDHFVTFKIVIPDELNEEEERAFRQLSKAENKIKE